MDGGGFIQQAKAKAAKYCSYKERAPQQVLDKLLGWGVPEDKAHQILADLISQKFVDEQRFCRAFCHDKFEFNQWGKRKIQVALQPYKLPGAVIEEGLNALDPERYEDIIRTLAEKKWEALRSESDPWKRKNKVAMFLVRKGFEPDLIWEQVNRVSAPKH